MRTANRLSSPDSRDRLAAMSTSTQICASIDARLIEARAEQARLTAAREALTAATHTGSFIEQPKPKRRGRPPGSKNKARANRVKLPELDAHLAAKAGG